MASRSRPTFRSQLKCFPVRQGEAKPMSWAAYLLKPGFASSEGRTPCWRRRLLLCGTSVRGEAILTSCRIWSWRSSRPARVARGWSGECESGCAWAPARLRTRSAETISFHLPRKQPHVGIAGGRYSRRRGRASGLPVCGRAALPVPRIGLSQFARGRLVTERQAPCKAAAPD